MNWPNSDSSSSPTGFSSETGAWAERLIESTSSGSMPGDLGDLLGGGLAAQLGDELALGAADLVELLDDVDRDADRARLVGERAGDRLADPPGRVGRELEALAVVELLRGADEAERALLDEVQERQALVAVVLGDRDDEAEVRLDHLLLRVEVAALDALGEVDLLLRGEQPDLADVLEEQLKGVRRHVRAEGRSAPWLAPAGACRARARRRWRRPCAGSISSTSSISELSKKAWSSSTSASSRSSSAHGRGDLGEREHADLLALAPAGP